MSTNYHELDPRGDVTLVLKSHSTPQVTPDDPLPFAERDDPQSDLAPLVQPDEGLAGPVETPTQDEGIPEPAVEAEEIPPTEEPLTEAEDTATPDAPAEPQAPDDVVALAEPNCPDTPRDKSCYGNGEDTGRERAASAGSLAAQGGGETPCDTCWGEIRLRVSLRHLSLASSYSERMFQGDWLEGETLRSTGSVEVSLPEDDSAAMFILMNIIHGHTRSVPRLVDLKTLTQLAVLVDYYQFHEAVEVSSDMWVDRLKEQLPQAYTKDLVRWICVSWVFSKPYEFRQVTRIAQRQIKGVVDKCALPIPDSIVG